MSESRFWEGVRHHLQRNRLTQESLAMAIGESTAALRQRMKRNSSPNAEIATKIAKILGTTVEELVEYSTNAMEGRGVFGKRLREGIARKELSIPKMSALSTVPEDIIRAFIEMEDPPRDVQYLSLLVTHLDGGLEYYCLRSWERDDASIQERKILARLRPSDRETVLRMAESLSRGPTE